MAKNTFAENDFEPHNADSALFVDDAHRLCPGCPESECVLPLSSFKKHAKKPGMYSKLCYRCQKQEQWDRMDTRDSQSLATLSTTLQRANKQGMGGPAFAEIMHDVTSQITRSGNYAKVVGKLYRRAINRGLKPNAEHRSLELAVDVGKSLLQSAADIERAKPPQVDLSSLTEEELILILAEPARQMLIGNPLFRKQILDDEEVRRVFLADLGIQTVDAEAVSVAQEL